MQTRARAFQKDADGDRQNDGEIHEKAIGEKQLADIAHVRREGQRLFVCPRDVHQRQIRHIAFHDLDERAAEEVAEADTEGGDGKTGHILIGFERHGQEAIEQRHQKRTEKTAKQRNEHGKKVIHIFRTALIEKAADDAGNSADIHDAGDAEVEVAGFLRQNFAGRAEQKRRSLQDSALNKVDPSAHFSSPLPARQPPFCGGSDVLHS